MSYYKGNNLLGGMKDKYIEDYKKGVYVNYKTYEKVELEKGMNKYNKELILKVNAILEKFVSLIIVESLINKIMNTVVDINVYYSASMNIRHLMDAQSGTIGYYKMLKGKLKTFKVSYLNTYKSIISQIDKVVERYERNKSIIDEWLIEYGFGELVKLIETKATNFFEYTIEFEKQYAIETTLNDWEREEYYSHLKDAFYEHILFLCDDNEINIKESVSNSLTKIYEDNMEKRKKIKEEEKNNRLKLQAAIAKEKADKDNATLFNLLTLDFENIRTNRSDARYIVYELRGEVYGKSIDYVVSVAESKVYYLTEDFNTTASFRKAKKFTKEEKEQLKLFVEKAKEIHSNRFIATYNLAP